MRVINLFGGPGAGKSTSAALIFAELKRRNKRVELVTEFAKQLTYDQRFNTLCRQPYVFAKQLYRIEMLIGHVNYIVTDSPIILSSIYCTDGYPDSFHTFVEDMFKSFNNLNIFINRVKEYQPYGRSQSEGEAREIDKKVCDLLDKIDEPYYTFDGDNEIAKKVLEIL